MKIPHLALSFASFFLLQCGVDELSNAAIEKEKYKNASLVVESPISGNIYLVGDAMPLQGKIVDQDGTTLEFVDLVWKTNLQETPIAVGAAQEVFLDIGIHSISVSAELPNGDKLKETLGGVRVQSPLTGVYAGNAYFDVTDFDALLDFLGQGGGFGGFGGGDDDESGNNDEGSESSSDGENTEDNNTEEDPSGPDGIDLSNLTASCVGGLDFTVDMWGKVLDGGGTCSISLLVIDSFDLNYTVTGDLVQNDASGEVEISLGFLPVGFDWQGEFNDNKLEGSFEGESFLFNLKGNLEARRLSRFVDSD